MLQSTVSLAADYSQMSASDSLGLGGSVTLLGVLVVFLALVALIIITMLYPKIATALINKSTAMKAARAEKKAVKLAAKKADGISVSDANVPAMTSKEEAEESTMDNQELIAVITAAIAASMGTSSNGIMIKSLRRSRTNAPAWGREGRNEQVYNRF